VAAIAGANISSLSPAGRRFIASSEQESLLPYLPPAPSGGDVSVVGQARLPAAIAFTILVFGLRTISSLESRARYTLIRPDQDDRRYLRRLPRFVDKVKGLYLWGCFNACLVRRAVQLRFRISTRGTKP
jgi:hypothetical protein